MVAGRAQHPVVTYNQDIIAVEVGTRKVLHLTATILRLRLEQCSNQLRALLHSSLDALIGYLVAIVSV